MVTGEISLKIRQGSTLVFLLVIALPVLFFSIGKAYYASLVEATENTLEAHLYSILAEVDFQEEGIGMPAILLTPELNRLNSDTFAFIYLNKDKQWQSESALNRDILPNITSIHAGETQFKEINFEGKSYWQLSFSVISEINETSHNVTFYLLKDDIALRDMMLGFRDTLKNWLIIMAFAITLLLIIGFIWSARPLQRLDKEIIAIESGNSDEIKGLYPVELKKITQDLNLLLNSQQRQKDRYRTSLSDLAHALKTPLAVLKSSPLATDKDANEQLDRINIMIEHQLKRAATGGTDTWKKQTAIKPVANSIVNAMKKVYQDKNIQFISNIPSKSYFLGDKTDLMELMGNLIDNACKACEALVQIEISIKKSSTTQLLSIKISDDGPGVPLESIKLLTQRGTRLDTYEKGHGVGMAIVNDLVDSYQGKLKISDSDLGGALFNVEFNYKQN
ncbi:ATP-binding protein [Pseudoalteromonas denitrificans]|uniref:histidine kinase n=1 Tax=Pseudoalteromonas denitrificans DSM 6059 TaxID=1123010 RepID=A0A1I1R721_9GAMM|nr:ATP-binding protein [Pseudoalteromonas denitrificans]SFD26090.1 two-component system, OmpR family, sensor histidine kinase PhoQ [Pseudoalteromonas denitrificans DSM 6059]